MGSCTGKEAKKPAAKGPAALKVLLIGQANVGKTSLLIRYVDGTFPAQEDPTLQNEPKSKVVDLGTGETRTLQIWDTAGSEKYRQLTSSFYVHCKGVMVVFDVTDQASFDALPNWLQEVQTYAKTNPPVVLVGNKTDAMDKRVVPREKAAALAAERGLEYVETSAATGDQVDQLFLTLTKQMLAEDSILGD